MCNQKCNQSRTCVCDTRPLPPRHTVWRAMLVLLFFFWAVMFALTFCVF